MAKLLRTGPLPIARMLQISQQEAVRPSTFPCADSPGSCFMTALTLAAANTIIEAAFAKGAELKLRPLGVSVLDAGGHLVAFQRQDGASLLRPQMSAGKAFGALAIGM